MIGKAIDRYADLAGVHIEEPGFNWGDDFCYCDYCRRFCQQTFGSDIRQNPPAAKAMLNNLAAFMCSDFFARLREMTMGKRPQVWLSANGSGGANPDWYIGRDWTTWARRGYLDFYVPQLYTRSVEHFAKEGEATKSCLGECDLVTGMAVSWSGIYPARQSPQLIAAEIAAARESWREGFFRLSPGLLARRAPPRHPRGHRGKKRPRVGSLKSCFRTPLSRFSVEGPGVRAAGIETASIGPCMDHGTRASETSPRAPTEGWSPVKNVGNIPQSTTESIMPRNNSGGCILAGQGRAWSLMLLAFLVSPHRTEDTHDRSRP